MDNEKQVESSCWYVIHTKLREECRAEQNLAGWGVETFSPRIQKRRNILYRDHPVNFSQSLFPRYIFARFNADKMLHKVYYTRGVQSVVSSDSRPLQVEDEIIGLIRSRLDEDGFVRVGQELKHGDKVTVGEGTFGGVSGIFDQSTKDNERVKILLTTISYQATIIVEKEMVQKAGH